MVSNLSSILRSSLQINTKNGLPNEIWRVVFQYLKARDLCRCQCVCKDWKTIIISIDSTRWKQLYLMQKLTKRWKHPKWPNHTEYSSSNIESWQNLYRSRYRDSKRWILEDVNAFCAGNYFFSRKRERRTLCVGIMQQFKTIKAAIEASSSYDTILVYAGTYEQAATLNIKCPIAVIGVDDPENVIIMTQVQVSSDSIKFENITLKPLQPRVRAARGRRTFIPLIKVSYGHLYMYNCHIDTGFIQITSPAMASISSCLFTENSFLKFSGVPYSRISNCLFHPEKVAIFVEEPTFQTSYKPSIMPDQVGGWIAAADEKTFNKSYTKNIRNKIYLSNMEGEPENKHKKSFSSYFTESDISIDETESASRSKHKSSLNKYKLGSLKSLTLKKLPEDPDALEADAKQVIRLMRGVIVKNIKVCNGHGGIMICRFGQVWIEESVFCNLSYAVRCLQNSRCVLLSNHMFNLESTGLFIKDHCKAFIAGNHIYSNGEAGIDIRSNADPVIQHNFIYGGKRSGIVCLDNGKGTIRENEIYDNKEAGVYILRKGSPKVKNNQIWSGQAAGIAVTEDGRGHITHNTISGMDWAGIDIRYGGNPVISHNTIINGKSDGIVVGAGGKSIIFDNELTGNSGCGIWVLDGSHPLIHSNRISNSGKSGIAFVHDSDQEHETQELITLSPIHSRHAQFQQDMMLDDMSVIVEDDFMFSQHVPDIEPESRFVHVSKPDKKYPQVEGNTITFNKDNGILYSGAEGVVIARNQIINNTKHGITLIHPSEITIQDNNIRSNNFGINVELGVCCVIQDNGIFDNNEYGIITAGSGNIKTNDIFGHSKHGIYIRKNGDIYIERNRLNVVTKHCIYIEAKSRCVLNSNIIYKMDAVAAAVYIDPLSETQIESANIEEVIEEDIDDLIECNASSTSGYNKQSIANILAGLDEVKPVAKATGLDGAPFYTAIEPPPRYPRSSFCIIL